MLVIPSNPTRKRPRPFDEDAYRQRNLVGRMFYRRNDWRRIVTRHDKLQVSPQRPQSLLQSFRGRD